MPQSAARQFSGIFVCYRRDDSSGHAGRLFDKLADHFGKDRIFMDIDTIEPGEDFVTVIENAVGSCEILIAIIGRHWLSDAGERERWVDDPNDFVRLEIATALKREVRVIPVLVQRASMPKPQDLPDDLVELTRRNAIEITDVRWPRDVHDLITVIERTMTDRDATQTNYVKANLRKRGSDISKGLHSGAPRESNEVEAESSHPFGWIRGKRGALVTMSALIVLALLAIVFFRSRMEKTEANTGRTSTTENDARAIEVTYWNSVREKDVNELEAYLRKYPNGEFKDLANIRLAKLGKPVTFDSMISEPNGGVLTDVEKGRLDNFAAALKEVAFAQGYMIVYGSRGGPKNAAETWSNYAKNYLVTAQDIDAGRLVIVDAGLREKLTTQLWIVPQGAAAPPINP